MDDVTDRKLMKDDGGNVIATLHGLQMDDGAFYCPAIVSPYGRVGIHKYPSSVNGMAHKSTRKTLPHAGDVQLGNANEEHLRSKQMV